MAGCASSRKLLKAFTLSGMITSVQISDLFSVTLKKKKKKKKKKKEGGGGGGGGERARSHIG